MEEEGRWVQEGGEVEGSGDGDRRRLVRTGRGEGGLGEVGFRCRREGGEGLVAMVRSQGERGGGKEQGGEQAVMEDGLGGVRRPCVQRGRRGGS